VLPCCRSRRFRARGPPHVRSPASIRSPHHPEARRGADRRPPAGHRSRSNRPPLAMVPPRRGAARAALPERPDADPGTVPTHPPVRGMTPTRRSSATGLAAGPEGPDPPRTTRALGRAVAPPPPTRPSVPVRVGTSAAIRRAAGGEIPDDVARRCVAIAFELALRNAELPIGTRELLLAAASCRTRSRQTAPSRRTLADGAAEATGAFEQRPP
jgi:hypothetical protein